MNLKITATFLDEISHDIPHQNWGEREWDSDFAAMKAIGINTVVLIRCGYGPWLTYPSQVLKLKEQVYLPPVDLVDMFLRLAEKHNIAFFLEPMILVDTGTRGTTEKRSISIWQLSTKCGKSMVDERLSRGGI